MKKLALDSQTILFILMKGEKLTEQFDPEKQHVVLEESGEEPGKHAVQMYPKLDMPVFEMSYPLFQVMARRMKEWSEALTTTYISRQTVCNRCQRVKQCYRNPMTNKWYCKKHYDEPLSADWG